MKEKSNSEKNSYSNNKEVGFLLIFCFKNKNSETAQGLAKGLTGNSLLMRMFV
jgi:hypothetical protein